jgi:hypothetical protein
LSQAQLPTDAELVVNPTKALGERIGVQFHQHLAALRQCREQAVDFRDIVAGDGEGDRRREAESMPHGTIENSKRRPSNNNVACLALPAAPGPSAS